jgi:hypothetical protein
MDAFCNEFSEWENVSLCRLRPMSDRPGTSQDLATKRDRADEVKHNRRHPRLVEGSDQGKLKRIRLSRNQEDKSPTDVVREKAN